MREPTPPPAPGSGRKPRLLIVDDEAAVRTTTAAILSEEFEVFEAASGADALARLRLGPVEVVCTDFRMPGMDGRELLRRVAELPEPVAGVMVTGYREFAGRDRSAEPAPYVLVIKPYEPEELLGAIRRARQQVQLRRTLGSITASVAPQSPEGPPTDRSKARP